MEKERWITNDITRQRSLDLLAVLVAWAVLFADDTGEAVLVLEFRVAREIGILVVGSDEEDGRRCRGGDADRGARESKSDAGVVNQSSRCIGVGRTYSIVLSPARGMIFVGWVADLGSSSPKPSSGG
jgi:hypothetical protein